MAYNSSSPNSRQSTASFPSSLSKIGAALTVRGYEDMNQFIAATPDVDSLVVYTVYKDVCGSSDWMKEQSRRIDALPHVYIEESTGKLSMGPNYGEDIKLHITVVGRLVEGNFVDEVNKYIRDSDVLDRLVVYSVFKKTMSDKAWFNFVESEMRAYPSFQPFAKETID